ncbi:MAG TPA: hypothetical protein VFM54_24305 [Micromonosporaceae bacterium]|nr:hypothetical protein [Micromonosporaceae bacterium]
MPTTLINAYTTPESTSQPVVHEDLRRLAEQVMLGGVQRFASVAERTAVYATLGISPSDGMRSYTRDTKTEWVAADGTWRPAPGTYVLGLRQTAQQTLTNNAWVPLDWDTEDRDLLSAWASSPNPDRFTPPIGGLYLPMGGASWAGNANGRRGARWAKNGAAVNASDNVVDAGDGTGQLALPPRCLAVNLNGTTDFLALEAFYDGGAAGLQTASNLAELQCSITIVYLGPA